MAAQRQGDITRSEPHFLLEFGKALAERSAGEHPDHVILDRSGLAAQFDTVDGQAPENRRNATIYQSELFAHEKRLLDEDGRYTHDALAQLFGRLFHYVVAASMLDGVNQGTPILLNPMNVEATALFPPSISKPMIFTEIVLEPLTVPPLSVPP